MILFLKQCRKHIKHVKLASCIKHIKTAPHEIIITRITDIYCIREFEVSMRRESAETEHGVRP